RQLLLEDQLDGGADVVQRTGQRLGKKPPCAVVAAQGVANPDYEEGGFHLSTIAALLAHDTIHYIAVRVDHLHYHRHLADGMSRATQAWVIETDAMLDAVKRTLGHLAPRDVILGYLLDGPIHGQVV